MDETKKIVDLEEAKAHKVVKLTATDLCKILDCHDHEEAVLSILTKMYLLGRVDLSNEILALQEEQKKILESKKEKGNASEL